MRASLRNVLLRRLFRSLRISRHFTRWEYNLDPFLRVFLRSTAGEIELSTHDHTAPFKLLDGARGFGLPSRSVESSPLPSANGSVFRSQRFDESEVML